MKLLYLAVMKIKDKEIKDLLIQISSLITTFTEELEDSELNTIEEQAIEKEDSIEVKEPIVNKQEEDLLIEALSLDVPTLVEPTKEVAEPSIESKHNIIVTPPIENVSCFSQTNGKFLLKIPIATIGNWEHPVYGTLVNTQNELDEIKSNYSNQIVGYEPGLYIGHQDESVAAAPSEGFLEKVEQVDNVLFGYWRVNKNVYKDVKEQRYLYSSGEFVRDYKNKETGETMGMALVGMALTNRPFIPNLPKVEALSDAAMVYSINLVEPKQDQIEQQEKIEVSELDNKKDSNSEMLELREKIEAYSEQLVAVEAVYKTQLAEVMELNKHLQNRLEVYEEKIKQEKVNRKLEFLSELCLPEETKVKYADLIKSGSLGEVEESVIDSLKEMSDVFKRSQLFTQIGNTTATIELDDATVNNPYTATIERNKVAVSKRKGAN